MKKLLFIFFAINCFAQPGTLDASFSSGTAVNLGSFSQWLRAAVVQSDGKIIVGGSFSIFNGETKRGIVRLNTDGSIDNSFAIGVGFDFVNISSIPAVSSIVIQPDGKIIAVGNFDSFNGVFLNHGNIIRLNIDGSIDTSFNSINFGDTVFTISLQQDGKIVVGGSFNGYYTIGNNGVTTNTPCKSILRLNSDGSVDTTFNVGIGPITNGGVGTVYKIIIQPDQKILVGGAFYGFDTHYGNCLARILSDGSVDPSFQIGVGFQNDLGYSVVNDIDILPDQSIFITGDFSKFDNIPSNKFIKLTPTGYKDFSFSIDSSLNLSIRNTTIDNNGKIILCATGSLNGNYIWNTIRLNPNGTNDPTFQSGTNFNDLPFFSTLQSDGKILYFGPFTSYNGMSRNNIARITGDSPLLNNQTPVLNTISVFPNPVTNVLNISVQNENTINAIQIYDLLGKIVIQNNGENMHIATENISKGIYFIKVFSENRIYQSKFIKE